MLEDAGESSGNKYQRSLSMPGTPGTPGTPVTPTSASPSAAPKHNVWRSVFNPGSNLNTRSLGADFFDRPQPNSPTVYDWYITYVSSHHLIHFHAKASDAYNIERLPIFHKMVLLCPYY